MKIIHIWIAISVLVLACISEGCLTWFFEREKIYQEPEVGDFACKYLQGEPYTTIIIEVDWIDGVHPYVNDTLPDDPIELLETRIFEYTDKTKVNTFFSDTIVKTYNETPSYTLEKIRSLEDKYREHYKYHNTMVIYVLYLDGYYEDNKNGEDKIGLAYSASSIAIFKDKIRECVQAINIYGEKVKVQDLERAVIIHEFGHLLGLVNIGYNSVFDHEEEDYPHNCNHTIMLPNDVVYHDCVMYHAIETTEIVNFTKPFGRIPNNNFCEHCMADLVAIKSGS